MAQLSAGVFGELMAARFLRDKKYTVITSNYRSAFGEVDIIAEDKRYIVFVEVKTRSEGAIYAPREAVTKVKQDKIMRTAALYLRDHPSKKQPRFDVIEIVTAKGDPRKVVLLDHLMGAYEIEGLHAAF